MGTSAPTPTTARGRTIGDVHRFRLALADFEALERARDYLAGLDVETTEFAFASAAS